MPEEKPADGLPRLDEKEQGKKGPDLLGAALSYAKQGVAVFPCNPWNKQPLTPHGFKDATTDAAAIAEWWAKTPNAIIGSPTGAATDRVVIDIDSALADEEFALMAEQAGAEVPRTFTVRTHGPNKHLYFRYPAGEKIGNRDREMPGRVNVRGEGGYVIVSPSPHPLGGFYEVVDPSPKADLPPWLLKLLLATPEGKSLEIKEVTPRWAFQKQRQVLAQLRRSKQGSRNNDLNLAAWWAARLGDHPLLKGGSAFAELVEIGLGIGLDEREVHATVNSGWHSGTRSKIRILPIHECTDLGNADRFVLRCADRVRHVPAYGANGWLVWDGRRWKPDAKREARRLAHETVRAIYREAAEAEDDEIRRRLSAWAVKSESDGAIDAMLKEAGPYLALDPSELDADPELLNLENGTLDMRTGEVRDQRQADLITRLLPVRFEPAAPCPLFLRHMEMVLPDEGTRSYFQEMVPYYLSGSTAEQCIHVLLGDGENGKSTTDDLFRNMAGDYGCVVKREFFAEGYSSVPPHDVADLLGRRIATCSEFEEGDLLRVSTMKSLTSGLSSKVRGCRKYGHPFEFQPQVKFLLDSNYPLRVDSPDHGTWRRIRVIPFEARIPVDVKDRHFAEKLWAERSGILNWIIAGLRRWNARGRALEVPEAVKAASSQYREQSDLLGQFLEEQCLRGGGMRVRLDSFTEQYREWVGRVTTKRKAQIGKIKMKERLAAKGFTTVLDQKLRVDVVLGIGFRDLGF